VRIILSEWYPFQSPELQLLTPLYHLNVKADVSNLEFCCTCCSFKIGCTEHICNIIKCYVNLIDRPDCRCTCNSEARILYHENTALYEARASAMVAKYAYPRQINS
jgi:ubiquitin-protein ligase